MRYHRRMHGLHVETTLGDHAVRVSHSVGVADEELEVALVGD